MLEDNSKEQSDALPDAQNTGERNAKVKVSVHYNASESPRRLLSSFTSQDRYTFQQPKILLTPFQRALMTPLDLVPLEPVSTAECPSSSELSVQPSDSPTYQQTNEREIRSFDNSQEVQPTLGASSSGDSKAPEDRFDSPDPSNLYQDKVDPRSEKRRENDFSDRQSRGNSKAINQREGKVEERKDNVNERIARQEIESNEVIEQKREDTLSPVFISPNSTISQVPTRSVPPSSTNTDGHYVDNAKSNVQTSEPRSPEEQSSPEASPPILSRQTTSSEVTSGEEKMRPAQSNMLESEKRADELFIRRKTSSPEPGKLAIPPGERLSAILDTRTMLEPAKGNRKPSLNIGRINVKVVKSFPKPVDIREPPTIISPRWRVSAGTERFHVLDRNYFTRIKLY